ncbi:hypothetical protein P7C70_g4424, partial [Phenoliferia sp. Uapishka_3]
MAPATGTQRSANSTRSTESVSREDSDIYTYALRVAVLNHNINNIDNQQPHPDSSTSTSTSTFANPTASTSSNAITNTHSHSNSTSNSDPSPNPLRQSTSLRPTDGWTKSILSLGDVFKDPSPRPGAAKGEGIKFPKDFLKVIDQKMEKVARGADPAYSDPLFRQTIGAFYGKFAESSFQRTLKTNRHMEELILTFGTTASAVLRRSLPGDEWKVHLDHQVGQFMLLVRDCLRSREVKNVPVELLQRLDAHCAKLSSPDGKLLPPTAAESSSSSSSSSITSIPKKKLFPAPSTSTSSSSRLSLENSPPNSTTGLITSNIHEMPLVMAVGKLFRKSDAELSRDVIAVRRLCTERAAFNDLKLCINNVAQGARFPARREDFDLDSSFQTWKKEESAQLSELIVSMIQRNPSLASSEPISSSSNSTPSSSAMPPSFPRTGSYSNRSSVHGLTSPSPPSSIVGSFFGDEDFSSPLTNLSAFTFVPPDPKFYFKRLYEIALEHDYSHMSDLPPDEAVPLTILTSVNESLLNDCVMRWRIIKPVRVATFLALVGGHYKDEGVPVDCVVEALGSVERCAREGWEYDRWPWADRTYLYKNLLLLFNLLLPHFFEIFEGILAVPYSAILSPLETIFTNQVFQEEVNRRELELTFDELRTGMKSFVGFAVEEELSATGEGRGRGLEKSEALLKWIVKETKRYSKTFPDPILGAIDMPAIFISVAGPMFGQHLESSRESLFAAASQVAHDEDLLGLYRGTMQLQEMHNAFCPETPLTMKLSAWFEPFIRRWLGTTDTKTTEWVKRAIDSDQFVPEEESPDKHSSSVVDLIASCQSAADFIIALNWPNEYENSKYLTGLSQTIAKSIQQYSSLLENMFIEEMFAKKAADASAPLDPNRPSAWLTKAKLAVQGDQKIEPFVFRPESLVKLNNIQAARKLLDRMYNKLDADKVAKIVEEHQPVISGQAVVNSRYLFTVKVVLAENLRTGERRKQDPFLILSDHVGHRVAKTRTLYETNDPRWDETFDVSVRGDLWLRATIYNRNLVEDHDIIARAYIHLNPPDFADYLPRDVWLRLEGTNEQPLESRVLLRISMEGEKDDIRFYFGRAFRFLKRSENDMTRLIVDKMSPFIRHYLSQSTLKTLLKTQFNFEIPDIDLSRVSGNITKATGKMTALVRGALTTDDSQLLIPSVEEYRSPPSQASARPVEPQQKKKGRGPLTDNEIEDAIGPLLDYFNDTFRVLNETLSAEAWELVSTRLWKEILSTIEALVLPPLSDQPTEMKPLSEKELDIVYKWRQFLLDFFHLGGQGLPMATLRNPKYEELGVARMYYDWSADALCEEAVRAMQRQLTRRENGSSAIGRTKSVYNQRNLGTIKAHKKVKAQAERSNAEIILRILRMQFVPSFPSLLDPVFGCWLIDRAP